MGSICGVIAVISTLTLISIRYPFMYKSPWKIYIGSFFLPFIGFGFGYVVAKVFRMNDCHARTVALETGIQNFPLCMTVVSLSFPSHILPRLALFPLLAGVFIITNSCIFVVGYLTLKKVKVLRIPEKDESCKMPLSSENTEKVVEIDLSMNPKII